MALKNSANYNRDWTIQETSDGKYIAWDGIKLVLLQEIRDELKKLNRLLRCPDFISIPSELRTIRTNTTTRRRRKVAKP